MAANDKIETLAARLHAANVMGRSEALKRLFDFLVARSGDAVAPKELEVAAAIFGGAANFDVSQDASVRVYIHRLRNKLDEYYAGPGRDETDRLSIPKGIGYRLIAEPMPLPSEPENEAVGKQAGFAWSRPWVVAAAIALLVLINVAAWMVFWPKQGQDEFAALRTHPLWARLLNDDRPITVVVGDYYIFGELGIEGGNDRLVREYTINSPAELDNYLMQHPTLSDRYMDMDLFYLPVSTASALRSIMPILTPSAAGRDRVRVVQASDLTPDLIKRTNIIYIGYLSGLGILREPVFLGSRFSVGDTYDELIDSVGNQHYLSQEGGPDHANRKLKDFGYFSTFEGPNGNHILIISGMRDVSVMETAEALSDIAALEAMSQKANGAQSFEALYQVEGIRRMNLGSRLLLVSPLKTNQIWNGQPSSLHFPNG